VLVALVLVGCGGLVIVGCGGSRSPGSTQAASAHQVLRVGAFHGIPGQFRSIQAAVDAARPGDWILIGPGDYKTSATRHPRGRATEPAGVLITTRDVHVRGMNRNTVVIDGTKPGSPRCSSKAGDQNLGPASGGSNLGLNGLMVWKAADVWMQNLTVCNFLAAGKDDNGNQIWWDGGDDSLWKGGPDPNDKIGGHGYYGSYLTATSTFYDRDRTAAQYGIFSSNWSGGEWDQSYASNFGDSGLYIGACQQVCDQTINHAWAEYNAVGYSGQNSGGQIVIENSQWDNNTSGINTNSSNGDNPPPQNGACPHGGISPITHTHSCWVVTHNYIHDNNNPNATSPPAGNWLGMGITITGGRNDTIMDNLIVRNDAWGAFVSPFVDSGPPCTGGTPNIHGTDTCLYDTWGNAIIDNKFAHNGAYGHPTNGDFGYINFEEGHPTNCFRGNAQIGGGPVRPASAAALQVKFPTCAGQLVPAGASDPRVLQEALCDSVFGPLPGQNSTCPTGDYPSRTKVVMHALPKGLPTMPHPCAGVPANPWCQAPKPPRQG
jgi:hypothetical protein